MSIVKLTTYKCKSCDARVSKPNAECSKCAGK